MTKRCEGSGQPLNRDVSGFRTECPVCHRFTYYASDGRGHFTHGEHETPPPPEEIVAALREAVDTLHCLAERVYEDGCELSQWQSRKEAAEGHALADRLEALLPKAAS